MSNSWAIGRLMYYRMRCGTKLPVQVFGEGARSPLNGELRSQVPERLFVT